jgi:hypothetical protein
MDLSQFPAQPGVYALLLGMKQDASLKVGRLGTFTFAADYCLCRAPLLFFPSRPMA